MVIMNYETFRSILNETIFEKSKADLLQKIADNPNRYLGLFRPTKPKAKILQNLLQSHEIRFGDAFEIIFEEYFKIMGCELLEKKIVNNDEILNLDQSFKKNTKIYFIEQKVRDDHDSTKKRGQIDNFEKKLAYLVTKYNEDLLVGLFYFLDPQLVKNKSFYENEINRMSKEYNVELHVFYGNELFNYLGYDYIWDEIILYLRKWKDEIPELPEINLDIEAEHTFEEIKNISPSVYRKLFSNDQIVQELLLTLFPQKKTFRFLKNYFHEQGKTIYLNLAQIISEKFGI